MATRSDYLTQIAPLGDPVWLYTNGIVQYSFVVVRLCFDAWSDFTTNYVLDSVRINTDTTVNWSAISGTASNQTTVNTSGYSATNWNTVFNGWSGLTTPLTPLNDYRDYKFYRDGNCLVIILASFQKNVTSVITYYGANALTVNATMNTNCLASISVTPCTCPRYPAVVTEAAYLGSPVSVYTR